ncbi:MAG: MinD/ParA family protein [Actinomycetota bacterium]|uniref:MinD/ParA family protein n=1 Tax=Mycobacterium lentiflavum TaxID=141349 RepID=A0ABY3UWQ9_MYCLN|nr:MinD/ParA family protein [Mycobacterium lentiflavum]MEE3063733.1 MinD/ParA family protein [Actinomycetota bacterium]ULP43177.1 MinD/ParA family protein [Mycobacterium lentiflavum]
MQVAEQSSSGVGAPEHPTADLNPQEQPPAGETSADPNAEAPTRAFAGFRTERRVPATERREAPAPPPAGMPPWDSTPVTGIPRVDPTAYGAYYNGPADAPAAAPAPYRREHLPHTPYPELSTGMLLRPIKPPPSEGWRRLVYVLSGRTINLGESPRAARQNNLVASVNRPLRGCYRIAVISLKGGVGKTTIAATLGATFAQIRGDRVVAVDANPDRGTLSQKVPLETAGTVRQLLRDAGTVERYSDVRRYTSRGPSGLEVLASESDPAVSEAFNADDYTRTLGILERYYGLVITDCGPGLLHSAMSSVLENADVLIVVSSGSIDGARSASATLDWLDAHGHEALVRNSIAVINAVRPKTGKVDMNKVVDHFSRRCRAVRLVPYDAHLDEGAEIHLDQLRRETREALTSLAAVVAEGFPGDQPNLGIA